MNTGVHLSFSILFFSEHLSHRIADIHTTMCKIDGQREPAVQHRELTSVLGGDLDSRMKGGWEGGPRRRKYMYA